MHVPDGVGDGSKLWVASGGRWRGYFVIHEATEDELRFYSDSWVDRDAGPRSPFQGFTRNVPEDY